MIHNKTETVLHLFNFNYWNKTTTTNRQPQGVTAPNRSLTSNMFSRIKESEDIRQVQGKAIYVKKMSFSADAEKYNLTTVILLSEDKWLQKKISSKGKSHFKLHANVLWNGVFGIIALLITVFWINLASTWDMVKQSGLFVFVGCSFCQPQEPPLLPTANQSQERVWMSVNHVPQMGHNLSPLITISKESATHCWPSPLNMLTVCLQLTHLSIAMQSVNRRKSPNLSSWNQARCQISDRRRLSYDNKNPLLTCAGVVVQQA